MLSYWRNFVPDFSSRTCALKKLLSQDAGDWSPIHTQEVRQVLQALLDGAGTLNFDPAALTIVETHTGPKGISTVCLQKDQAAARWLPLATYSCTLEGMEVWHPPLLLELTAL